MNQKQCPTCGRCDEDWSDLSSRTGEISKERQLNSKRDKTAEYRSWRWKFGSGCYASDIDMIEWRIIDGKPTPVAIHELTELPGNITPPPSYFQSILDRYQKRDGQADAIVRFAGMMNVDAFIVVFRWDLSEFWVYNLSRPTVWKHADRSTYERGVRLLGKKK